MKQSYERLRFFRWLWMYYREVVGQHDYTGVAMNHRTHRPRRII